MTTRTRIDQELAAEFRASLRGFVEAHAPIARTRAVAESDGGFDREVWRRACLELQAASVSLPEDLGGSGLPLHFQGIVFQEFGRALVPSPMLATTGLAANIVLCTASEEQRGRLLAPLIQEAGTATVAWVGSSGDWDPAGTPAVLSVDGTVSGELHLVLDGATADTIYVVARSSDGLAVVAVDREGAGVTTTPEEVLDPTRPLARGTLEKATGEVLGSGDQSEGIAEALRRATLLLCYESAGGARRAMEMAVDYAKVRYQFNRPIGSYQSIKHRCADMLARVESMDAIVEEAAQAHDESDLLVHVAKSYAAPAFFDVAAESIQIHGGIGFTWEHDAHLFFRRAKSSDLMFGDSAVHRTAIAGLGGW